MEAATPATRREDRLSTSEQQGSRPLHALSRAEALPTVVQAFVLSRLSLVLVSCALALVRQQSPLALWNQWDGRWYLGIAAHGYHWGLHGKSALAFFPFYPLLVHLSMSLGVPGDCSALVLSNGAFAGALLYLYSLIRLEGGAPAARRAVWLLALFPTALFTFAPYTESLFLLASAGALYHARRRHWLRTGLWLAVAILTRSTGVIAVLAVLALARSHPPRAWLAAFAPPVCAAAGYLEYLRGQHLSLSGLWQAQHAWHRALTFPWTGFVSSFHWLAQHGVENLPWTAENLLQLGVTVVFLALTVLAWRHLSVATAVYCAAFWLLVLTSPQWLDGYYAPLSSMDRFVLALFPLAGWIAARLPAGRFRLLLGASGATMAGSAAVYLVGGWVG